MFSVVRFEFENNNKQSENESSDNTYLTKVENKIKELKKKKNKKNRKNNNKDENVSTEDNSPKPMEISPTNEIKDDNLNTNKKENKKRKIEIEIENNENEDEIEIEENGNKDEIENDNSNDNDIENNTIEDESIKHIDKKKKVSNNQTREERNKNKKEKSLLGLPEWLAKPTLISPYIEQTEENNINNSKFYLSKTVISCLNQMKITHLFPVQTSVLPFLLSTPTSTRMTGDLCVSAPTGSGKTLAYVLPIVETLSKRIIQRLRALIILPTRDLVAQVKETFNFFTQKTNLKVVAITGSISFTNEQSQLIDEKTGNCKVDVVIATPGRLIDHLNATPGFTLSHLRYLIIDEADRLLNQHYQDWLNQVLNCINSISKEETIPNNNNINHNTNTNLNTPPTSLFTGGFNNFNVNDYGLPEHSAKTFRKNNANLVTDMNYDYLSNENRINHCTPVQKLLFSATLTRNPAKIASLQLYNPTYISVSTIVTNATDEHVDNTKEGSLVDSHYVIPPELHESMMVCKNSGQKPLALFHLLFNVKVKNALCFTNSLESAHRLGRLIHIFNKLWEKKVKEEDESDDEGEESSFQPVTTAVISSEMPLATRRKILHSSTLPTIIICSDIMARGLDLSNELSFDYVINYEIPNRPKTYVHRVGRTARAGKEGQAVSIVEAREAKWFKDMMSRIDREENKKVKKNNFKDKDISPFYEVYNESLKELKEEVNQKKFNKDNKKMDKRHSRGEKSKEEEEGEERGEKEKEEESSNSEDDSSDDSSSSESEDSDSNSSESDDDDDNEEEEEEEEDTDSD